MKKLGKIKLNQLSKSEAELKKFEMNVLKGGDACVCVCMGESFPRANYPVESHANTVNNPFESHGQ